MNRYKRFFIEKEEIDNNDDDIYKQEYDAIIEKIKNDTFRNKEKRIEFAKLVMQLATNPYSKAKKLVYKMSEFVKYWENDEMIDDDEWRWLNNSENLDNIE